MKDYTQILVELQVELKRIGENLRGTRVKKWCQRAGYQSIDQTPEEALEILLQKVKQQPTQKTRKKFSHE
jgi:hypothetical protein